MDLNYFLVKETLTISGEMTFEAFQILIAEDGIFDFTTLLFSEIHRSLPLTSPDGLWTIDDYDVATESLEITQISEKEYLLFSKHFGHPMTYPFGNSLILHNLAA